MINDFFLTEWFFDLLRWLYSVLGNNYFLTIFIVTLALRIIQILPDINNRKNQRKQAKIQPEIENMPTIRKNSAWSRTNSCGKTASVCFQAVFLCC